MICRFRSFAFTFLTVSKLLTDAHSIRNLHEEREVKLSELSIRFEKCGFLKGGFLSELGKAGTDDIATAAGEPPLNLEQFVIFRLCPDSSCDDTYGEYIVDIVKYLELTVHIAENKNRKYCERCDEMCQNYYDKTEDIVDVPEDLDCARCINRCERIEDMFFNTYADTIKFANCEQIQEESESDHALWAGPMCSSHGSTIKIGDFSDKDCKVFVGDKDVEDYVTNEYAYSIKLSPTLLKTTYDKSELISCHQDADHDAGETKDVCRELYTTSAKCEFEHGFRVLNLPDAKSNQIYDEKLVCSFIDGVYGQE